ncbi:unnamed protein product [Ilex paraguariensis]|uniref:Uncharacterized protein n=1 Tax=Ilex paraguariensis TaxID=185542 RepID=A0ABC8RLA0_9AQUA
MINSANVDHHRSVLGLLPSKKEGQERTQPVKGRGHLSDQTLTTQAQQITQILQENMELSG